MILKIFHRIKRGFRKPQKNMKENVQEIKTYAKNIIL